MARSCQDCAKILDKILPRSYKISQHLAKMFNLGRVAPSLYRKYMGSLFLPPGKSSTYNPGQKCWDTCTFSLKIAPLRFPPPPSPSQCCISGLKVHFFEATLTRGEGGRHFAQTRPSRALKTERLANACHIFRLSQGLLSRIVWIACAEAKTTITPTGFNVLRLNLDSKVFETLCTYSIYIWVILNRFIA